MKVGAISLITAFLIALPLVAFGGPVCPPEDPDDDGDGLCNSADNCDDTVNPAQADGDSDGQGDLCDNCLNVQNGPTASAGGYPHRDSTGAVVAGYQCDTNSDGYGNACDGDMTDDGFVLGADYNFFMQPAIANGPLLFPSPPNPGTAEQAADMNCDNFVLGSDYNFFFVPAVNAGPIMAGRSGLACAGTPPCPPSN